MTRILDIYKVIDGEALYTGILSRSDAVIGIKEFQVESDTLVYTR